MRLLITLMLMFVSLALFAQSRDTLVAKQLYYLERDSAIVDTSKTWSNKLTDYIEYSRLEMGSRMNRSIMFQDRAKDQFYAGTILIGLGAATYTIGAWGDPVVYIEGHPKYTRDYYNDAKHKRRTSVIIGGILTGTGVYLMWRSRRNQKKSKWCISPNGIKYNF